MARDHHLLLHSQTACLEFLRQFGMSSSGDCLLPSLAAWGGSDQSFRCQSPHVWVLGEGGGRGGSSGSLLSGGEVHSFWLRDFANLKLSFVGGTSGSVLAT